MSPACSPGREVRLEPWLVHGKSACTCCVSLHLLAHCSTQSLRCWLCRYWDVLRAAAGQIASAKESNNYLPLVLNLGPPWGNSEVYLLFGNNTIEIPFKDWESPPGLGICPLGVIFTVCSSVSSWLALNPANVVVRTLAAKELAVCSHFGTVGFIAASHRPALL